MNLMKNAMRNNGAIILLILILIVAENVQGQVISRTITWNSNSNTELHSNVVVQETCKMITNANSSIDLVCENADTLTFSITSIEGALNNPDETGSIIYHVEYQERPGKIYLDHSDQLTITIDFTESTASAMKRKFLINSFE
jgi:hypothetical protein